MSPSEMTQQMTSAPGFIAALDQSGGSTPNTLKRYGVENWRSDEEMFSLIHRMRSRIITSPAFSGQKIIGAILFKITLESEIEGVPTAKYLISERRIVPFLKVDNGLATVSDGVRLMKPIPELKETLKLALTRGVFGTKMRSVIDEADSNGISEIVTQQFDFARQILEHDLVPIVEPEVTINIEDKAESEDILLQNLTQHLKALPDTAKVILKLTLPESPNLYAPLLDHPCVMRVVALSGGYSLDDATAKLRENRGMIASFSRALTSGLLESQTDQEFNTMLTSNVEQIFKASVAGE